MYFGGPGPLRRARLLVPASGPLRRARLLVPNKGCDCELEQRPHGHRGLRCGPRPRYNDLDHFVVRACDEPHCALALPAPPRAYLGPLDIGACKHFWCHARRIWLADCDSGGQRRRFEYSVALLLERM